MFIQRGKRVVSRELSLIRRENIDQTAWCFKKYPTLVKDLSQTLSLSNLNLNLNHNHNLNLNLNLNFNLNLNTTTQRTDGRHFLGVEILLLLS